MTPALERRTGQPVPTTQAEAAERFQCRAYLCTMDGARCRDQHVHAVEFKPLNRDACIDCPAGATRTLLLGAGANPGRAAICQHRTAKGLPCANPPASDGICHAHRGAAASAGKRGPRKMKTEKTEKTETEAPAAAEKPKIGRNAGIAWDDEARLGKMHPAELAKLLGVTATAVRSAMNRRGLVYVAPEGGAVEAPVEAAAVPAKPTPAPEAVAGCVHDRVSAGRLAVAQGGMRDGMINLGPAETSSTTTAWERHMDGHDARVWASIKAHVEALDVGALARRIDKLGEAMGDVLRVGNGRAVATTDIDAITARLDALERRIESMGPSSRSVSDTVALNGRLDALASNMDRRTQQIDVLVHKTEALECRVGAVEGNVEEIEGALDTLEARMDVRAADERREEGEDDDLTPVEVLLYPIAYDELLRLSRAGLHGDGHADVARTLILDGLRRAGGR